MMIEECQAENLVLTKWCQVLCDIETKERLSSFINGQVRRKTPFTLEVVRVLQLLQVDFHFVRIHGIIRIEPFTVDVLCAWNHWTSGMHVVAEVGVETLGQVDTPWLWVSASELG